MKTDLNAVERRIMRHFFNGSRGADLICDPDNAISQAMRERRSGRHLWMNGPAYQANLRGIEIRENPTAPTLMTLTWKRISQWARTVPDDHQALVAATAQVCSDLRDRPTVPGHRLVLDQVDAVRDAAVQRCYTLAARADIPAALSPESAQIPVAV